MKKHIFNGSGIDENKIKCKFGYWETSIGYNYLNNYLLGTTT